MTKAGNPAVVNLQVFAGKQNSVLFKSQHPAGPGIEPCREYKRKQISGFVILPIGVGSLIGGSLMVYKGVNDIAAEYSNANFPDRNLVISKHDIVFISAGTALTIVGLALIPTGLAMGTIGTIRYRRYCNGRRAMMYITPAASGLGLACKF